MIFFLFLDEGEGISDTEEVKEYKKRELDFEIPKNFLNPDKYDVGDIPDWYWGRIPPFIVQALTDCMGPDVPIDPMSPFVYLRQGRLPQFVVVFFMELLTTKRRTSKSTIFYRSMHLMERFRERLLNPPSPDESINTASVQAFHRAALLAQGLVAGGQPEEEDEEEDETGGGQSEKAPKSSGSQPEGPNKSDAK